MKEIILRIEPSEANARQLIAICMMEKAYKALCHVYTAGLGDYITPLGVLLQASRPPKAKESPLETQTRQNCTRLCITYLSKVLGGEGLAGAAAIPEAKQGALRGMIYEYLFIYGPVYGPVYGSVF